MTSLTVLQKTKLITVTKTIHEFKTVLVQTGLNKQQVQNKIKQTIIGTSQNYIFQTKIDPEKSLNEMLMQMLSNSYKGTILQKLRRIETNLYIQLKLYQGKNIQQVNQRKKSEVAAQKIKKQKKQKKQKKTSRNIFQIAQKTKQNSQINPLKLPNQQLNNLNIFRMPARQPFQQATLPTNIFLPTFKGLTSQEPKNLINIFMRGQNQRPIKEVEKIRQRQQLKRNLRQINAFKQFIEKQMMLEVLTQAEDSLDTIDFGRMLVGPLGMEAGLGELR